MPWAPLTLMAVAVFAAITTEVLPVGLLPQISESLHTSESRVGLLVTAYAVMVAFGCIPLTALVARWPRRPVLVSLLVMYAISNAALAGAGSYWVALGARIVGGIAHAGFFSVVFSGAVALVPPARVGRAVAFVSAGNALGVALGVPAGTALGTAFGWRWAFTGAGIVMAVLAGLSTFVVPAIAAPAVSAHEPVLVAARRRPLLRVAATVVVLTLGHYTAYTYVSPLLEHAGVARSGVSLVLFGYGAAGVVGLAAVSTVVDRHPHHALQAAMSVAMASLVAVGLLGSSAIGTAAAVVVWGAAFGTLPTLLQTAAFRSSPQSPDAAPAIVNTTFNLGIGGGALLGSRELVVVAPPALALTGAALVAVALAMQAGRTD